MDDVTQVEESLRDGLRPVRAPDGFTDRVMARVQERQHGRVRGRATAVFQPGWLAIAAALLVSAGCGEVLHLHQQQQAQAAARAEVDRALQLTSHAMNQVEAGFENSSAGQFAKLWRDQ